MRLQLILNLPDECMNCCSPLSWAEFRISNFLNMLIFFLSQASVSVKRIQHFLTHDELDPNCVETKVITPGKSLAWYCI